MKNLVIVFGVFVALFISSCETTNINDEIGEIEQTELQGIEPGDDGAIDDGDRREDGE
ncbi:hypothetical protein ACFSTE_21090 [Aquimarina hainanensis]|uniref:Uncharacterized protein n=1 Tax=Aquimarina hainanensis TaxID=1578017 RepID=A0ABW5NCL6_9FLAO